MIKPQATIAGFLFFLFVTLPISLLVISFAFELGMIVLHKLLDPFFAAINIVKFCLDYKRWLTNLTLFPQTTISKILNVFGSFEQVLRNATG
jgi:hypothetical protein